MASAMRTSFSATCWALALSVAAPAHAQRASGTPAAVREPTTFAGADLIYAEPRGEFRNYVRQAFGASGHLIHSIDAQGVLAFRAEVGYLTYGQRTTRQALGGGALGLIDVDVTTSNNIVVGSLGAQLMAPNGSVRPYAVGAVGFSYFFTESSVSGTNNGSGNPFVDTQNFGDGGFSSSWGGGLYIPIRSRPLPLSIDLGVQMHKNADIQYLTKGSITFNGANRPPTIAPVRSAADYLSFRIGVSAAIR